MKPRTILLCIVVAITAQLVCAQGYGPARLPIPDRVGALELTLGDFEPTEYLLAEVETGLGLKVAAKHRATGAYMTVFVQPAPRKGTTSLDCRSDWWGKADKAKVPFKRDKVRLWKNGSMALAEFFVTEYQGQPFNQRQVHGYLASPDLWAEIHLSKVNYTPEDDKLFDAVLNSARMLSDYVPTGMDYLRFGSFYYLKRDYRHAIVYYQRALDLDKQSPQLDPNFFKVVVDQLGMSYGLSGDLKHAKEVFEYGLSKDPEFPFFYYNLACTFAEMNDLDNALVNLEKAFEHRQNVLPGEKMPDPRKDDSFKRFLNDEKFIRLVDKLAS